jgi:methionyl-tRNA formyltransferase
MDITILTDNQKSWFVPYGKVLLEKLAELKNNVSYVFNATEVKQGDVCFLLSCTRLVPAEVLRLNKNNIVVHASDLPKGKGFSPLQWQVVEGSNKIPLTLFEVTEGVDAGPYYLKDEIIFSGYELLDEMRKKMAEKIIDMCIKYITHFHDLKSIGQEGEESFYKRRTKKDDELDVNKTIAEQFNHLRIANNDLHPLYFHYKGEKYILKIYKEEHANSN